MKDWDNQGIDLEDIPPEMRHDQDLRALFGLPPADANAPGDSPPEGDDPFEEGISHFKNLPEELPPFDVMARLNTRIAAPAPPPQTPPAPWWRSLWEAISRPIILGPALALGLLALVLLPSLPDATPDPIRLKGALPHLTSPKPSLEAAIDKEGEAQDARRAGALPPGAGLVFYLRPGGGSAIILLEKAPNNAIQVLMHQEGLSPDTLGPISPTDTAGQPLAYTPEGPSGVYVYRLLSGQNLPHNTPQGAADPEALWALGDPPGPEGGIGVDDLTLHVLPEVNHARD